jgi:ribosomal protein S14
MLSLKRKDIKKRNQFHNFENNIIVLKSICYNQNLLKSIRWNAGLVLSNIANNSSKTKIHNSCIISKRTKGVNKTFRLSRISLKRYVCLGYGSGIKKNNW